MTPEDAVHELKHFLKEIEQFPNDDTFRCELDRDSVNAILAAIRAAENDALERAATACDGKEIGVGGSWMEAAQAIRALKHEEDT